jgi:hypothetical protein
LFEDEAQDLPFTTRYEKLAAGLRPLVIGSLRFPGEGRLVLHTLSIDRAIHGVRFFGLRLGRAAKLVRGRVLNRWLADTDARDPDAIDLLLDQDVVTLDPEKVEQQLLQEVQASGAAGDPERILEVVTRFCRRTDVPAVEDFPIYPEDEAADYSSLVAILRLRFLRAARLWERTDVNIADLVQEFLTAPPAARTGRRGRRLRRT